MIEADMRAVLAAALCTDPVQRHQLFSLVPPDTFRGAPFYFTLGRFFATNSAEKLDEIAKATALDIGAVAELMDEWNYRPLRELLIKLLARRQSVAMTAGQDVTPWASAIARLSESQAQPLSADERKPLFVSATDLLLEKIKVQPLLGRLIERGCTGQIFGPSGGGKTFVALDMSLSVGTGGDWIGNRCEQGIVLYFAGEGHSGLKRRVNAWTRHNGYPDLADVYVSRSAVPFNAAGMRTVVAEVKDLETQTGRSVALLVIDTLARHLEGDENSTRDMCEFVRAVDGLRDAFPGSTAVIVHHTGNNTEQTGRSRGSSALKAACDFEIQCDKGLLTFTKLKDGDPPAPIEFKLVPVEIGVDDDGVGITSCVVSYGERAARHREVSLTAAERELLGLVQQKPGILTGDLRTALFELRRQRDPDVKYDTMKKAYARALDGLIQKQKVFMDGYAVIEGQGTNGGHSGDMSLGEDGDKRDTPLIGVSLCPSPCPPGPGQVQTKANVPGAGQMKFRCDGDDPGYIQDPDAEPHLWREPCDSRTLPN